MTSRLTPPIVLLATLGLWGVACGDGASGVGTEGASVSDSSGEATVHIPAGAVLAGRIAVALTEQDPTGFEGTAGLLSPIFDATPDGTSFARPVTVELPLDAAFSPEIGAAVAYYDEPTASWVPVPSEVVDGRVFGRTTHFTAYAAVPGSGATLPAGCSAMTAGVPPLNQPNGAVVVGATRTDVLSGGSAVGPVWLAATYQSGPGSCVRIRGNAGPVAGEGLLVVYGSPSPAQPFPIAADGSFELTYDSRLSPYIGLRDACHTETQLDLTVSTQPSSADPMDCASGAPPMDGGVADSSSGGQLAMCPAPSTISMTYSPALGGFTAGLKVFSDFSCLFEANPGGGIANWRLRWVIGVDGDPELPGTMFSGDNTFGPIDATGGPARLLEASFPGQTAADVDLGRGVVSGFPFDEDVRVVIRPRFASHATHEVVFRVHPVDTSTPPDPAMGVELELVSIGAP